MDRIEAEIGSKVDLNVLLLSGNGDTSIGTPTVDGARVVAEVLEHGRDAKIIVFKYKNKTRYSRRKGHRQGFTRLAIREIVTASGVVSKAEGKPVRRPRSLAEPEADESTALTAGAPEATTEAIATETPKRARKAKADHAADDKPAARKPRAVRAEAQAQGSPEAEAAADAAEEIEAPATLPEDAAVESEK